MKKPTKPTKQIKSHVPKSAPKQAPSYLSPAGRNQVLIIRGDLHRLRDWLTGYQAGCSLNLKSIPGAQSPLLAIELLDDFLDNRLD